jgi:3-hydroxyisobutyrate dehydrogenase-like beta-hydroxyacid dehydrogenase
MNKIGFMGFGEVASRFGAALRAAGSCVMAYDILLDRPGGQELLAQRAAANGPEFVSLEQMLAHAGLIFSTVTTDVALQAAKTCAPGLGPQHVYVDLNATSPQIKRAIADIITPTGAAFVEGAILGAVGVTGAQTRVLLCGQRADGLASSLRALGLNVAFYGTEIGRGSTFKLLRSVFSKGLEALLLEAMLAARRADVMDDVWQEIVATLSEKPFAEVGSNWMLTHGSAHERRYHEMVQVEAMVRGLGVEPLMTAATTRFFERSTKIALSKSFARKPVSSTDVVDALDALMRAIPTTKTA